MHVGGEEMHAWVPGSTKRPMLLTEMRRQVQLLVRQDYVGAETGRERRWRAGHCVVGVVVSFRVIRCSGG